MGMVKGLVENVSTKWDKYSVQVNGSWYSTKMEWAHVKPNKGDLVEFDDGGSKFTKNMKIITAGAGGTYGSPKPSTPRSSYNSLGVELGHAANLAMTVVLAGGLEPGSNDFYKSFATNTRKVKAIMDGLREEYEGATETKEVPSEAGEDVVVMKSGAVDKGEDVTTADLF